ncbi:class I SAM-dependent methyltransferase [Methanobacterium alcaliphilum]|uniref:class I SAM-dependent methyltransferase n=1 Tax=Methanobacterium alcaliphilum TaxID=392018 RepID=UPI00200AE8BA|nr:class I SAM-dependent methyltransferase [Methanobacterium alcaliphilum]MCK9151886.1 class I SAM-dependent methyltransferase [Methanobacterium alcaliphilum]
MVEKEHLNVIKEPMDEINWAEQWKKELMDLPSDNKKKDWNKIAKKFKKWTEKDDYPQRVLNKIETEKDYSVLDVGCGNGIITIPLAKKVSNVTCVDISSEMLDILKENAQKEGIENLTFLKEDLAEISLESVGKHDVIVASRCLNGVHEIGNVLKEFNKIGKYVYLTVWGPNSRKFEDEACKLLKKENPNFPSYIYIYNMLYQMGIAANVEKLEFASNSSYSDIDEALDNYKWKMGDLNPEEEEILKDHLKTILVTREDGRLENPHEQKEWILIWWKSDEESAA